MGKAALWRHIPVSLEELCIDTTLRCGQSFRWQRINDEWHCSLHGRVISLKQDAERLSYRSTWSDANAVAADNTEDLLKSYFHLVVNLGSLYEKWSQDDVNFEKKAPRFSGVRILNQDPWETLVCFICSSNNNISRISQMAQKLCLHYGRFVGSVEGERFYDFPTAEALAAPSVEKHLRALGFGYRAKYIAATAQRLADEKANWLVDLRNPDCPSWPDASKSQTTDATYKDAHESLLALSGVGPKVADCVCLMGLGWGEAVPVDTHMWQIATRDYRFKAGKSKTLSLAMYHDIGDYFRGLWGSHAGWAQSVLFTANLRAFSDRLEKAGAEKKRKQKDEGDDTEQGSGDETEEKRLRRGRYKRHVTNIT